MGAFLGVETAPVEKYDFMSTYHIAHMAPGSLHTQFPREVMVCTWVVAAQWVLSAQTLTNFEG